MGYLNDFGLYRVWNNIKSYIDTKLSDNDGIRRITQAEYDALTDEQKRGAWMITDAPDVPQGSGGNMPNKFMFDGQPVFGSVGSSGSENVYSTEEQAIGTWIDGKPLYRKTFELSFKASTDTSGKEYDIMIPDLDERAFVVSVIGSALIDWTVIGGKYVWYTCPFADGYTTFSIYKIEPKNYAFRCWFKDVQRTPLPIEAQLVLTYTKTTD